MPRKKKLPPPPVARRSGVCYDRTSPPASVVGPEKIARAEFCSQSAMADLAIWGPKANIARGPLHPFF